MPKWWGPAGFTTTLHAMDVREGGASRYTMHGPDGKDWPNKVTYLEVVPGERLVYDHGDFERVHFHVTITFVEMVGRTKVTMRSVFPTAAARDFVVREVRAIEGGNQTFDRLGAHLAEQMRSQPKVDQSASLATERDFVITRIFDAPRELVFRTWTDAKHVARWWGPREFTIPVCELDLRVGGAYRIVMRGPDGVDCPVRGVFREIVPPEKLVMTVDCSDHSAEWHDFLDPARDKSQPPKFENLQTVTFEALGARTKLTILSRFPNAAIRDAALRLGMTEGWSESLDKLGEALTHASVA
jgi:uncharacterized protein YndB with AHSA1/START domain